MHPKSLVVYPKYASIKQEEAYPCVINFEEGNALIVSTETEFLLNTGKLRKAARIKSGDVIISKFPLVEYDHISAVDKLYGYYLNLGHTYGKDFVIFDVPKGKDHLYIFRCIARALKSAGYKHRTSRGLNSFGNRRLLVKSKELYSMVKGYRSCWSVAESGAGVVKGILETSHLVRRKPYVEFEFMKNSDSLKIIASALLAFLGIGSLILDNGVRIIKNSSKRNLDLLSLFNYEIPEEQGELRFKIPITALGVQEYVSKARFTHIFGECLKETYDLDIRNIQILTVKKVFRRKQTTMFDVYEVGDLWVNGIWIPDLQKQ